MTKVNKIQSDKKSSYLAWLFGVIVFSALLFIPISVDATTSINWDNFSYTYNQGDVFALKGPAATFSVNDDSFLSNGMTDSITVQLTSSVDSIGIPLVLTENPGDTGIFTSSKILFMLENSKFTLSDSITVTIEHPLANVDSNVIDTISGFSSVSISSDTDPGINNFDLIETDINSGIFSRIVSFTAGPTDESMGVLQASANDTITILDHVFAQVVNGLITPSDSDAGIILTAIGGTATVSYDGSTSIVSIIDDGTIGGGTGGLVRPSLVVDSSNTQSNSGSNCSGDCVPPTLGVDKDNRRLVQNGFSYNENLIDVNLYYTPYPLITVDVGKENVAVLKIYENSGTQNIEHISLAFGLGKGESFNDSKATITLDRTRDGIETISVYDPENVLDDVRVVTERDSCSNSVLTQCLIVYVYHTFREPLNFNMVGTLVWDFDRNSWQNYYNHGIHIVGESLNPPKTTLVNFGTHDMHGSYELTRIDKVQDLWQDEFGNIYQNKGNDRYDLVYSEPKPFIRDTLTSHGCDRNCNWFNEYKLEQEKIAKKKLTEMLNGKIIEGEPPENPVTIYFHFVKRSDDPILQQNIKNEIKKATELYMEIYPKKPIHNFLN